MKTKQDQDWEKEWREFLIRSLFSGEEVGIKRIFSLAPKKQCWVDWEHLEGVAAKLLSSQRQRIEQEIEGMKRVTPVIMTRRLEYEDRGYNQALNDVLAILKKI